MYNQRRSLKPTTFQFVKCEESASQLLQETLNNFTDLSRVLREFEQNEKHVVYVLSQPSADS